MADKINQLTSSNSTDNISLNASLQNMIYRGKLETDGMIPAMIVSFDRENNFATVKPLVQWLSIEDAAIERPELTNIPVMSLGGGGFHISFPLKNGDLGWIFASDRDLSSFKENLSNGTPKTGRTKSFSDSIFIPDVLRKYSLQGEDSGAMVIQATNSATRISIKEDSIKITAAAKLTIDAPITEFLKKIIVNDTAVFNNMVTLNGGLNGKEGTSASLPSGTKIGGIDVSSHGHEQNGDSGRTSGGMES